MLLKKLYLHHFRNYTEQVVTFSPGVNWITGKNAQGKTNLLEAIYVLSTGRSFRSHQLKDLIEKDASYFYLEAEIEKDGVNQTLKFIYDGEVKKIQHNATNYQHYTPLMGLIPHVLYAPDDHALITGAPALRRKFLNLHIAQIDPLYIHHLGRFHKAMKQRNELLKQSSEIAIDPWENIMSGSSSYLMTKRLNAVNQLQKPISKWLEKLSYGDDTLEIQYQSSFHAPLSEENILQQLKKSRKRELFVGNTLYGPHRDELYFTMKEMSAKAVASEGQKHSILAALRFSLWEDLKKQTQQIPLMSIDDFGAHLDQRRQEILSKEISLLGQVFLTSPSEKPSIEPDQILWIESGAIRDA